MTGKLFFLLLLLSTSENITKNNFVYAHKPLKKTVKEFGFKSKTKGLYEDNVPYKKFVNEINERTIKDRKILLSIYAYIYQKESRNYGDNISKRLSELLNYSEAYIKNLTKEIFNKNFIKNSSKGSSGGILTSKSLKFLNSL